MLCHSVKKGKKTIIRRDKSQGKKFKSQRENQETRVLIKIKKKNYRGYAIRQRVKRIMKEDYRG